MCPLGPETSVMSSVRVLGAKKCRQGSNYELVARLPPQTDEVTWINPPDELEDFGVEDGSAAFVVLGVS